LVIGSGIAGLAAAWRLTRSGFEVSVLERAERPGGRVWSESRDGFILDRGAQLLSTADRHVLSALRELELGEEIQTLTTARRMQQHGGEADSIDPHDMRGILRIPGVRFIDGLRVSRLPRLLRHYGDTLDPDHPERAASLDFRSMGDFIGLYFGQTSLDYWAGPWLGAASLCDPDEASRAQFLLHVVQQQDSMPVVLRSGFGALVRAITERVDTRLDVEALAIRSEEGGRVSVELRRSEVEDSEQADAVVLATSPAEARRLGGDELSWPEEVFLGECAAAPGLGVTLGLKHSFVSEPRLYQIPRVEGSPLESVWVEAGEAAGRVRVGKRLVHLLARDAWAGAHMEAADEVVVKELLAAAGRVDMRFEGERVFAEVIRTQRAFPRFEVGRFRALARFRSVQEDRRAGGRRLYFAGDYLQGASLEAAFTSGLRAAEEVIADL